MEFHTKSGRAQLLLIISALALLICFLLKAFALSQGKQILSKANTVVYWLSILYSYPKGGRAQCVLILIATRCQHCTLQLVATTYYFCFGVISGCNEFYI